MDKKPKTLPPIDTTLDNLAKVLLNTPPKSKRATKKETTKDSSKKS